MLLYVCMYRPEFNKVVLTQNEKEVLTLELVDSSSCPFEIPAKYVKMIIILTNSMAECNRTGHRYATRVLVYMLWASSQKLSVCDFIKPAGHCLRNRSALAVNC